MHPFPFPQPERTHVIVTTVNRRGSAPYNVYSETKGGEEMADVVAYLARGLNDHETLKRVMVIEARDNQDAGPWFDVTRGVLSLLTARLNVEQAEEVPTGLAAAYRDYEAPLPSVRYTRDEWEDERLTADICLVRAGRR